MPRELVFLVVIYVGLETSAQPSSAWNKIMECHQEWDNWDQNQQGAAIKSVQRMCLDPFDSVSNDYYAYSEANEEWYFWASVPINSGKYMTQRKNWKYQGNSVPPLADASTETPANASTSSNTTCTSTTTSNVNTSVSNAKELLHDLAGPSHGGRICRTCGQKGDDDAPVVVCPFCQTYVHVKTCSRERGQALVCEQCFSDLYADFSTQALKPTPKKTSNLHAKKVLTSCHVCEEVFSADSDPKCCTSCQRYFHKYCILPVRASRRDCPGVYCKVCDSAERLKEDWCSPGNVSLRTTKTNLPKLREPVGPYEALLYVMGERLQDLVPSLKYENPQHIWESGCLVWSKMLELSTWL
eukprot:g29519.t1